MKITFITTVYNEEKTIESLLSSILLQTKLPSEVVIVDALSKDKTRKIIESYKRRFLAKHIKFSVFLKIGNRAIGRNFAIKKASYEIIVCSDAGCKLAKNWMVEITKPI